ncbi:nitroreductase family protein [Patescibacteria group bacterium]|nr:nitroreductase family protein [Patescibacteria group bacterium]MBU1721691.1 nitroreductase family protein [Patescibacteria group bacterium]MBU1901752.1 nitroreductase family protein [Patescibacteria group bacterium]
MLKKDNYSSWNIQIEDCTQKDSLEKKIRYIISLALLAPSSHNSQPWAFSISGNTVILSPDQTRVLPISDPDQTLLWITFGCVLENISIASDYLGLNVEIEDDISNNIVCTFIEKNIQEKTSNLALYIAKRKTNRSMYESNMPNIDFIKNMIQRTEGVGIKVVKDKEKKRSLSHELFASRYRAFADKAFRKEMSQYKRNNLTKKYTGIPGATMGFPTLLSFFAPYVIRLVNVMRFIKKKELQLLDNDTPLLVCIGGNNTSKKECINIGRAVQRILLEATEQGLATSINAVTQTSKRAKELLHIKYDLLFYIRVGYSDKDVAYSPRLPLDKLLK